MVAAVKEQLSGDPNLAIADLLKLCELPILRSIMRYQFCGSRATKNRILHCCFGMRIDADPDPSREIQSCDSSRRWSKCVRIFGIDPTLNGVTAELNRPAEDVPHTAHLLVEILLEAGLPPEVIQLVHGQGSVVGRALVEHPEVPVISFTGSTETGSAIGATCGKMHKRLSLEMGGKNAMIVMDDADLDLALDGVLWGAFGTTGQRCTATSRLILQDKIHDKFVQMLVDRTGKLRLGPGLDAKTEVGPLIHEEARQKVAEYVDIAKKEGASVALGGKIPQGDKRLECGWFYEPTVLTGVKPGMRVEQEEIFGPVLAILKAKDLPDAIQINNDVKYGLSSSLYTRDINGAFKAMTDLDTGITYVNAPTIGAEAHLPFGGVKQTGNGHREGGWEVYDFYSETKTIYVDFSGTLQRAQIDTESSP